MTSPVFRLKVQRIQQVCCFELSWGQAQSLAVQLNYPDTLTQLYQTWQYAYLSFYQSSPMRGRAVEAGITPLTVDWHAELVKAEASLMVEFHRWLRSGELFEIRAKMAQASRLNSSASVNIFLTCSPIELARFPWEAWEIGTEAGLATGAVQLIRSPLNIAEDTKTTGKRRRDRSRILVILGDETGLNFQAERAAVRSLLKFADIQFTGWQPGQTRLQVMHQITEAIADAQGWDVLLFAGHSNETTGTGGELGIAPGTSILISEITPQLIAAKDRGLKVALFNSCSGLSIADALISLGFSQVVIMREPIHNHVAQEFLIRFLQGLSQHQNVQESLLSARQALRLEMNQTYPSASLIPSLFCHPEAKLFRLPPWQWKQKLLQILPTKLEAIAIVACVLVSLLPSVQQTLTERRMVVQSFYRDVTGQLPTQKTLPVALVEIDKKSINRADFTQMNPIDRSYLAILVKSLRNAKIVGVDILLDKPKTSLFMGDQDLSQAVSSLVEKQQTWFVFSTVLSEDGVSEEQIEPTIVNKNWSLQGVTDGDPYGVELPDQSSCDRVCPFSYLLALVYLAQNEMADTLPTPQLDRTRDLRNELLRSVSHSSKGQLRKLRNTQFPTLSLWSPFLYPLIDFSIPTDRAYQKIPAWQLLDNPGAAEFSNIPQQVVIIAAGNDERLGLASGSLDRSPMPPAGRYWNPAQEWLTGGESLAYMVHHVLNNRWITPISDLWMIGAAILLGKAILNETAKPIASQRWTARRRLLLTSGLVAIYGAMSLQLYITAALLLPWLLPSLVLGVYLLPTPRRKPYV
jgi:CHASE2 domain/CHAT domain